MTSKEAEENAPWRVHFFRRERGGDLSEAVPAMGFLKSVPSGVAAKIQAVLEAVAEAPPPSFSGGGMWKAMRGDMAGFYEVCVQGSDANYRLLCLLDRHADDLGGSSIICVYGFSKPKRQSASGKDYRQARKHREEFERTRNVLN